MDMHSATETAVAQPRDVMQRAAVVGETIVQLNSGNMSAVVTASSILTAGIADLMTTQTESAKDSVADTIVAFSACFSIKSFNDLVEIQSNLLRAMMDRSIERRRNLANRAMKLREEAYAPIQAQFTAATERLSHLS